MPKNTGEDPRIQNARVFLKYNLDDQLIRPVFNSIYDIIHPQDDTFLRLEGATRKEIPDNGSNRKNS